MSLCCTTNGFFFLLLLWSMLVSDVLEAGNVTLESITIFRTHEWLGKPSVYFRCQGEQKVYLPDVVQKDQQYNFIGYESWQPLTSLSGPKCKRCGLYEQDAVKHDDVFDEWELCPINFSLESEGRYNHFKEKEFNMTLICTLCHPSNATEEPGSDQSEEKKSGGHSTFTLFLVLVCIVIAAAILFIGYKIWLKKKREEQQARFIKLFEDDEDLEAELGLRD